MSTVYIDVHTIDGVRHVGPSKAYGTLAQCYATRAGLVAAHDGPRMTDGERKEVAIECLHSAVAALRIDDPLRSDIIRLIRSIDSAPAPAGLARAYDPPAEETLACRPAWQDQDL